MKKLLVLLCLIPGFAFAQNSEKAKEILDKVTAKTKTYTTIKADFSFSLENLQEDIKEEYQGTIAIKGDKYKAHLMDVDTYFDGKTLWTHMIDVEEVNVDEPDPDDEDSLNPATIFTIYQSGFKYAYMGEKVSNGVAVHSIDLFPIKRDKPYSRINLEVKKDDMQLHQIKQVSKDGNNYTIAIKELVPNIAMDDNMFVFDPNAHPEVDVIDMR
ncbi:Outer membrane lipoprotein-sorting protein [Saccharicrinis carchari]|uniref:Outer membrane lipoprotein-sorting protein n=1 Tax=Saccharicrinis carchari TaxID=1168039 RepID=A0A521BXG3_SACCC|nr:outer membrane lipoprotein carrier protein LolA [Saccharicrinis carchari]SMO51150.1 Outer membrane lipoprotein-sorting protein [Saccharicrinis carchari]